VTKWQLTMAGECAAGDLDELAANVAAVGVRFGMSASQFYSDFHNGPLVAPPAPEPPVPPAP
jgi:hypothetical protein